MKTKIEISYLSLGSNIGNRLGYLEKAIKQLNKQPEIKILNGSSVYETAAWGLEDQDDFYNMVIQIETSVEPNRLLRICQQIEQQLGRTREIHWGPRTIDIDILLYGDLEIEEDDLLIPHPYLLEREFVVTPLHEIAPKLIVKGIKLSTSANHFWENSTCRNTSKKVEFKNIDFV